MRIIVKVIPRARLERVAQLPDGSYKVWVRAAPADNQANERLIGLLAAHFRIGRRSVTIVSGHQARRKVVEINR